MIDSIHDAQAKCFRALGHPARIAMVEMMRNGPICSCEIEPKLGLTQSTAAKHLAILRESGLVSAYRDGSRVMCQVLDPQVFEVIDAMRRATELRLQAMSTAIRAALPETVDALHDSKC